MDTTRNESYQSYKTPELLPTDSQKLFLTTWFSNLAVERTAIHKCGVSPVMFDYQDVFQHTYHYNSVYLLDFVVCLLK